MVRARYLSACGVYLDALTRVALQLTLRSVAGAPSIKDILVIINISLCKMYWNTQVGMVDCGTRVPLGRSSRFHLRSRRDVTASVCVHACACVRVCVCVCACDLWEDVNVVMNQEKKLVIGAIDRNHLMRLIDQFWRIGKCGNLQYSC